MEYLKDILVVLSPILVAYISYRSNKKSKQDIQLEIEKSLKEKNAETSQTIQRINAELESQKQLASWNNSMPQSNEYAKLAGIERYGNICSIHDLIVKVGNYVENCSLSVEELKEIKCLLLKVKLPTEEDQLFPYEIPPIIDYNKLIRRIDELILSSNNQS